MTAFRELYRAEQLPVLQNRMFSTAQAARDCLRGDVVLVQDMATGLVFNRAFDPGLMHYDSDYQNEQGHSAVFQQHLENVAGVVTRHLRGKELIEVGCGKGLFLEQLQRKGFSIVGLDPTYEGDNPAIRREYFTPSTGLSGDALILRHVLEHVPDPLAFLAQLREANGGKGWIYLEVPCLDWIAEQRAWFDLFYEHVNYFRLCDLERMFGTVHEAGRTFGGQYLYVVADLATLRTPDPHSMRPFELPSDFLDSLDASARQLERLSGDGARAAPTVIWGGASKGVVFAVFMERVGARIDHVVDINPAKQGRFLAGSGLRVQPPAAVLPLLRPGSALFVMNHNYLSEIQELTRHRFNCITIERGAARLPE